MSDTALIETARDFNRFYTNFLGLLNKAYLDTPFTLTDARILFEIGSHDGVSATALVRDLHLDPAYLSRILKRFRAEGLIETSPDPADLRSQVIIVTDQGRETFEELSRRSNAQIAARFDRLATGELAAARTMGLESQSASRWRSAQQRHCRFPAGGNLGDFRGCRDGSRSLSTGERRMAKKSSESGVYRVTEIIGTSTVSWEAAAKNAVDAAAKSLRDLRVAEISKLDMKIEGGKVVAYRARVQLSFKYGS